MSAAQVATLRHSASTGSLRSSEDARSLENRPNLQSLDSKAAPERKVSGPTPNSVVASFRQGTQTASCATYFAIIVAMMGALMFGIDQGNYGIVSGFQSFLDTWCKPYYITAPTLEHPGYTCTTKDPSKDAPAGWVSFISWGGSLITLGAAVGCMSVGPTVSSKCGRKPCISLGGFVCFGGCLIAGFLHFNSVAIYYVGRFVTGFGAGICCFALPMYSSEIATPSIRGFMGSFFQLFVVVGGLVASLALLLITDWRWGMLLPGVAGAIVGSAIWLVPESPRYVMDKHGYEAGEAALQQVRKGDVASEARDMEKESQQEAAAGVLSYRALFAQPGSRHRVIIACYLQIAQQLTGVNAFLSYTSKIFEAAGIDESDTKDYNLYFNILMLGGCIAGLLCIDSSYGGRRSQLLSATLVMGPPLIVAGVARLSAWPGWIPIVALALYGPGFQFAWGIVPWLYPSEIFSMNEKDKAMALATLCNFVINFLVTIITPQLLTFSSGWTFIIFGLMNVANFFFVFRYILETKGIPLDQVHRMFDGQTPLLDGTDATDA